MDFGSAALTIVKCVVPCISSQIGYIVSYKKNLEKLEIELQRLEATKASVQRRTDEAQKNGEMIEDVVQIWLEKANGTIAETKKLLDTDLGCCMGHCPNLWTRNRLSSKFEEMTPDISQLIANGRFDTISYRVASENTITPFGRGYEALDSRTSLLNEMKESLKDPKIYMIGVHGMGGVGKTTLMNELAWQVKKDASFSAVAIASVTSSPDVEKIQDQIAERISGRKLESTTKLGRADELRDRIKHEKSVLIILDDIWSELDLTEVGIPFGDDHDGCNLVMTSRDLNVLRKMGSQREFNLRVLLEEDSWNLFQKMAGDVVKEFDIKPIAEKVAKCCAGLPLLIVTVAKGLRKKDVTAWRDALIQLERFDHQELHKKVYPALELSFNCLENDELKSLFLFIGSFGLDHIYTGEIFSFYCGLGSYDHMDTLTEARNRHYRLINDLRASSLLLEDDADLEWIRMHDVVRDVAKSIALRFHPTYAVPRYTKMKEWPKVDQFQKCHYIVIPWSYIAELPENLDCPQLTLLQLENIGDDHLKVPDNFFSEMREVRALSLYGMSFIPSLPPSLHNLINLRTLNLCGCKLGDIRMVAKLRNLEILDLQTSSIKELPKEIGHVTRLRLLNLARCSQLKVIPTNLISSLICLEELYMGNCHIEWENCDSESNNASLSELQNLHRLTTLEISIRDTSVLPRDLQFLAKLERYIIFIGDMWEWSMEWSGGARQISRTLKLTDSLWTNVSLTTVEDLSVANLKGVKDVLYELNDEGFPQLKHLHIQDSDELLHVINSTELSTPCSAFPNLETMILRNLSGMKEICYGPYPEHSFEKLKVIKVDGCDSLKNLLLYSLLKNLSQLCKIKITGCKDMKEIIALEKQDDEKEVPDIVLAELHSLKLKGLPLLTSLCLPLTVEKDNQAIPLQALFNQKVVMPKLEKLVLDEMNTCKIWDDKFQIHSCMPNFKHLQVKSCNRLTSLFSSSVARALIKLQFLLISDCSMLKEIFVQEEKVEFPNLETLAIGNMYNLKSIWPNRLVPNSFCKLKEIYIINCEGLDYLFPISVAKELRHLQRLKVSNCSIENIVEKSDRVDISMALVYLKITDCENMKTIIPSSVQFHNLNHLEVENCNGVVNIFMPSTITCLPKLRILSISECEKLEEIYGSRIEGDASVCEIGFMKLEELTLASLPKLTSFCHGSYDFKFRSLKMVSLTECPLMETFCHGNIITPSHTKVRYEPEYGEGQEDYWDGDLNKTVRKIFIEKNSKPDMSSSSSPKSE